MAILGSTLGRDALLIRSFLKVYKTLFAPCIMCLRELIFKNYGSLQIPTWGDDPAKKNLTAHPLSMFKFPLASRPMPLSQLPTIFPEPIKICCEATL